MTDEIDEEGILLIVNPLKDFLEPGGAFYNEDARAIIPNIASLAKKRLKQGWLVIVVRDDHRENDLEVDLLGEHAMHGTRGAEIVDELAFLENSLGVIHIFKNTLDSFFGKSTNIVFKNEEGSGRSDLINFLRLFKPDVVEITGVCIDLCVAEAARGVIMRRNAGILNRNMRVVIYEDCVATFDDDEYTAEEKTRHTFRYLEKWFGVEIIDTAPK